MKTNFSYKEFKKLYENKLAYAKEKLGKDMITGLEQAFNLIPEGSDINPYTAWNAFKDLKKSDNRKKNFGEDLAYTSKEKHFKRILDILKFPIKEQEDRTALNNYYYKNMEVDPVNEIIDMYSTMAIAPPALKIKGSYEFLNDPVNLTGYKPKELKDVKKIFIRNLYTEYEPLRGDFYNVKLNKYDQFHDNYYNDGTIYFNKTVKNQKKYELKLKKDDKDYIELLKKTSDNLFEKKEKETDANHRKRFTNLVANIENKGVNFYRHLYVHKLFIGTGLTREGLIELMLKVENMNTSLKVILTNYSNNK